MIQLAVSNGNVVSLKAVSKKIKETRAADDLIERIAQATPAGMFGL